MTQEKQLSSPSKFRPWTGLFGGAFFWYFAHEIGFYYSDHNCGRGWILPTVHAVALIGCVACGYVSYTMLPADRNFDEQDGRTIVPYLALAAACLFTLVILWQGSAALIFSGCER